MNPTIRTKAIVIGLASVLAGAASWWFVLKPSHQHRTPALLVERQIDFDALTRMRKSVPKVEFGSDITANVVAAERVFTDAVLRAEDASGLVPEGVRRALVSELAVNVGARSASDSDEYVRMVLARSPRWIPPGDERAWTIVNDFMEERAGAPVDPSAPEQALRAVMDHALARERWTYKALGEGAGGCIVKFGRVRTRDSIENELWLGDDANTYWMNGPTATTIRLWRPPLSLEDVLRRDKVATVARVCYVVKDAAEQTPAIVTLWYYDPQSGKWLNEMMQNRGRVWHGTVY